MDFSPLWLSLQIACCATVLTVLIGVPVAWCVHRAGRFWRVLIDSVLLLPLVLPPTVVGYFLLVVFGNKSAIGLFFTQIGFPLLFTVKGGVLAATVVAIPLLYQTLRGALAQMPNDLIACAQTLGIKNSLMFRKIVIPHIMPSIGAGMLLAFARAIGEFGATMLIAGNIPGRTQTMSLAIYSAINNNEESKARFWSLLLVGVAIAVIILLSYFNREKQRR